MELVCVAEDVKTVGPTSMIWQKLAASFSVPKESEQSRLDGLPRLMNNDKARTVRKLDKKESEDHHSTLDPKWDGRIKIPISG